MKSLIALGAVLISGSIAFAGASQDKIDSLVLEYYRGQNPRVQSIARLMNQTVRTEDVNCPAPRPAPGPSCVDVACQQVGKYNCDDFSEIDTITKACRGNYDGGCVAEVCDHLGKYNCDDLSEITNVATMCRSQFNGDCVKSACDHAGKYNCDDFSEMENIAKLCVGVPASCLDSVCAHLGTYNCDDLSELEAVGNSCRGN